jgi:hypothetical protein
MMLSKKQRKALNIAGGILAGFIILSMILAYSGLAR